MKILILGPAYPFRGGIADTNESLARALLKGGHDVKIITFTLQYPKILFPGKTQYSSDKKPSKPEIYQWINTINPINWINSAKKINELDPDIVVIRYWLPFMALSLGTIARRIQKRTLIIALCDNVIPHEKRIGDEALTRYFIKSCDTFIAMSKTVIAELNQFTDKPKIYIPHPINDNLGEKIPGPEARKYLNLNLDGRYILFFGLLRKYKGLDILLQAMSQKKFKEQKVHLIVAGEFYDSKEEYLQLMDKLEIRNNVIIVDQYISTSEIKYYFSAVDLVVQTYRTASQSGVSQIAYNFDVPMLVTDVGGLSETVIHKKAGYVSSTDPEDIAEYIADFFVHKRSEGFIKIILKEKVKFSWDSFAQKLVELSR